MYVITVNFEIYPEVINLFKKRVLKQAKDSLKNEKNCLIFDVFLNSERKDEIFLYEVYKTKIDFQAHLSTKHYLSFEKDVKDWIKKKTINKFIKQEIK